VLGGLMSLGYQIGTIMRRTSTIVSSGDDVTSVKFDDVENLGKYVQVSTTAADAAGAVLCRVLLGTCGKGILLAGHTIQFGDTNCQKA
jgi:hypothetical protein